MTEHVKYFRTLHVPWSASVTKDDRIMKLAVLKALLEMNVVITVKMDGENTTGYNDGLHARSLNSGYHPSRSWLQNRWGAIAYQIPDGTRVCGENMYAEHSIAYKDLESYFYIFSVWEGDTALSWDDTVAFAKRLDFPVVPVLARGKISLAELEQLCLKLDPQKIEGIVVRPETAFNGKDFSTKVAKYVREGHVQTGDHWMHNDVVVNGLAAYGK
jgi:hypothetical protein